MAWFACVPRIPGSPKAGDDGVWTADAEDANGRDLKPSLDPDTGE